jgi:hypothetical protein
LAAEGDEALSAQKYDIAEDRFRRADALVHAPTLVVAQGRALMGLGRLVEAYERFQLALREGVAPGDPESWNRAEEEARKLSAEMERRIAWLTVSVPRALNPKVEIDGKPVPPAALGVPRATDPGTRTITAGAEGYATRRVEVTLAEGARRSLQVLLARTSRPEAVAAPSVPPPVTEEPTRSESPSPTLAYTMFGVGGVGLLVGSVTGILTLDRYATLDSVCGGGTCPLSAESDLDAYHSLGTTSGIALAVGVAGTAAGVVLLLTGRGGDSEARTVSGSLQVEASPGCLGIRGAF